MRRGLFDVALAQPDGFFDGKFVEWVHAVFDAGGFDGGLRAVDARFNLFIVMSLKSEIVRKSMKELYCMCCRGSA